MMFYALNTSSRPRYIIDPVAFFVALVGGPVLFTLLTFWAVIPLFALAIGGLPYLLVGTPALLIHLRRHPASASDTAWIGFVAFSLMWVVLVTGMLLSNPRNPSELIVLCTGLFLAGAVFSSAWGGVFGWIYTRLARDFYTRAYAH